MLIVKDGHIFTSLDGCGVGRTCTYSQKEVEELEWWVGRGVWVSERCLDAFLGRGRGRGVGVLEEEGGVRVVARDYRRERHRLLLCEGGFVGMCTGDDGNTSRASKSAAADSISVGSAASRMPPELFTHVAQCFKSMYGYDSLEVKQFSKLSLVCSYWAKLYRPMQWRLASFRSPARLSSFLSLLTSTPPTLPPVSSFIDRVVVLAIGVPPQPWIHLIPLQLKRHLFSRTPPSRPPHFTLSIVLRTEGLPSASDQRVYMPATHDALPKSLAIFDFRCQSVALTGVDFRSFESFVGTVRAFRRLEELSCARMGWVAEPPGRLVLFRTFAYPPLRRVSVQPFPNGAFNAPHHPAPHWVSALWCWARRRVVEGTQYFVEDEETLLVMKVTEMFQGFWRRKATPTLEMFVKERWVRGGHGIEGFDVCFDIDKRAYTFVFTFTAERTPTTPSDDTRLRDKYHALHLECITICSTTASYSELGLGILVDHAKFWKQAMELPFPALRHVVVAFARYTEGEVLRKTLQEHVPGLLQSDAGSGGSAARTRKLVVVQSDQDPPREGCRWMKLDLATFEPKGPSCAWYSGTDPQSPDNIHGLSRLLVE